MHDLAQALKVRRKEAVHRLLAGFDILGIVWAPRRYTFWCIAMKQVKGYTRIGHDQMTKSGDEILVEISLRSCGLRICRLRDGFCSTKTRHDHPT